MILKDCIIGSWKSYQIEWRQQLFLQGRNTYTLFRFLKDGTLYTEITLDNKGQLEEGESKWDIREYEENSYLEIDGKPLYQIVSLEKDVLKLQANTGPVWYFTPEEKWSRLDLPYDRVCTF